MIDLTDVKEMDHSRTLWIVTFEDGNEFVCFTEEEIEDTFGPSENYIVVKGTWTPED